MTITDERAVIASPLADLRDVNLGDMEALADAILAAAIRRVIPEPDEDGAALVPVAAFQSAI